jgi:hypothetical protein
MISCGPRIEPGIRKKRHERRMTSCEPVMTSPKTMRAGYSSIESPAAGNVYRRRAGVAGPIRGRARIVGGTLCDTSHRPVPGLLLRRRLSLRWRTLVMHRACQFSLCFRATLSNSAKWRAVAALAEVTTQYFPGVFHAFLWCCETRHCAIDAVCVSGRVNFGNARGNKVQEKVTKQRTTFPVRENVANARDGKRDSA